MDNLKRPAEPSNEPEESNKKIKTEEPDLLTEDLDELLNQQIPQFPANNIASTNGNSNRATIDFNDIPDDVLDSIDATVTTPDMSGSRSSTPVNGTDLKLSTNMKFDDPRRTLSIPQQSQQQVQSNSNNNDNNALHSNDPTKLNDALAAAGVDIQREEELLTQQRLNRLASRMNNPPYQQPYQQQPGGINQRIAGYFLNPYHVASFMHRLAKENGIIQNFLQDIELLELMSVSCEKWIADIVTKTLMMSRHRQRSQPIGKMKSSSSSSNTNKSSSGSDVHQELRNLARKHRELEERRVERRIALGLEKSDENGKDESSKAGAEETLHKAANATAAMMTMNPGRKKYSWMTSGNTGAAGNDSNPSDKDSSTRRSHLIAVRGENGIRLNNTRITQAVTMKDLLSAIEDERMGVDKAVIKGYSKLRD